MCVLICLSSRAPVRNPQDFVLLLVHDGHDLSAYVGQTAGLDDTCIRRAPTQVKHRHVVVTCASNVEMRVCASQTCEVFAVVLFDPLRRLKLLFGMFL